MLAVYLDTSIYDHIDKGYVSTQEVEAFRAAISRGDVVVHLGIADIEELLGQWKTNRATAIRKLGVARDLAGFRRLLKPANSLLDDAIMAYANGAPPPSPLMSRSDRQYLARILLRLAEGEGDYAGKVTEIVSRVRQLKEEFLDRAMGHGRVVAKRLVTYGLDLKAPRFEDLWGRLATQWAEAFADRSGQAAACRRRGLEGLLAIRPVRLAVGAGMSLAYSQIIEGREPRAGDAYDLWHAVMASAADIFVTKDGGLERVLGRIPIEKFRVVPSLGDVLAAS